jgi:hypothetical protein
LNANKPKRKFGKLGHSEVALAIPVTFLILFVSMLGVISITYYFAVERVNANSQFLKVSMSKENMYSFDQTVDSVLWQPGSSRTLEFGDYGGTLDVRPSSKRLLINVTDGASISDTIFNATGGQVAYELPYAESSDTGLFLKGDSRTVVNQSGSEFSQLSIQNGAQHVEVQLSYRPVVSVASETGSNTTINDVSIYLVSLNSSQEISVSGNIPLIVSCTSIENIIASYNVSYQVNSLAVTAILNGTVGQVSVPILSTSDGASINVKLVLCNVQIERWTG